MTLIYIFATLLALTIGPNAEGLRILGLFPLHGKSHFIVCEQLSKALAAKGHQIDVYSHFPQKKPIPNYTDFSLEGTMPAIVNNVSFSEVQRFSGSPSLGYMIGGISSKICELMGTPVFQDLFERLKKEQPYDLIIIETFVSNCYLAWGRHLKIPMIGLMTSGLIDWYNEPLGNPHNPAVVPGTWSEFRHPMTFIERLQNTIMLNMINIQYKYYAPLQDKYVEQYFGSGYPTITQLEKDIDLMLVNAHFSLEGIRSYTPAIVPVAGLHIQDDGSKLPKEVQKWLDESEDGCIYISFGSMVRIETFPKHVLDALYASFKNISPVRVLMKIAKPEELPPNLPKNVMTQSWFSQVQVLKHKNTKAFVTHGGLASTQESIYAGVPLVGIPLFGDQHLNVKLQVSRKIAVQLQVNEITEKSLTAAFREILSNPSYRQNAEKFSTEFFDRPMAPIDTAVFWVEYVARHGKNCLRNPIVDMPWWQANLIDVYAFIIAIILFAIYIIKFVLCKILGIFLNRFSRGKTTKVKRN